MVGVVIGNYQILEEIGEGATGLVYRALDTMLQRTVAIKRLRPELAGNPNIVNRFRAEAVTLARLNHQHVATLYNFVREGDGYLMVMEYVEGETLERIILDHGAMPCDQALPLFCQALSGVEHAHQMEIVHRDLKPGNMMLTAGGQIKVMDFGIARVLGTSRLTRAGRLVGTIEYMSPEQVRGKEAGPRSDVYSLGIVFYEMLTGDVPFKSESEYDLMRAQVEAEPPPPRQLKAELPQQIEDAILRALSKDPDKRFSTAGAFLTHLLECHPASIAFNQPRKELAARVFHAQGRREEERTEKLSLPDREDTEAKPIRPASSGSSTPLAAPRVVPEPDAPIRPPGDDKSETNVKTFADFSNYLLPAVIFNFLTRRFPGFESFWQSWQLPIAFGAVILLAGLSGIALFYSSDSPKAGMRATTEPTTPSPTPTPTPMVEATPMPMPTLSPSRAPRTRAPRTRAPRRNARTPPKWKCILHGCTLPGCPPAYCSGGK